MCIRDRRHNCGRLDAAPCCTDQCRRVCLRRLDPHRQRIAVSDSCSCSDRSSAQLTTTPATSLQSLQIPRVDPPIALPASFSKCLNVHNRLQMAVALPLPACHRHFPSITKRGICSQRHELGGCPPVAIHHQPRNLSAKGQRHKPRHLSASGQPVRALSYLPVAGQHELREVAASGQPVPSVPISTLLKASVAQARLAECKALSACWLPGM